MNFYEEISPFYDDMINFSNRLEEEKKVFNSILSKYPAKTALDAGCGSGFHTILLSQLHLEVSGMDVSESMLELAKKNARKYHVDPLFLKGDFLSLNKKLSSTNDAVYCLGNSFVHLLNETDQMQALENFRNYLTVDGYLCLQIVNYDKILKNKQSVLAVRELNNQKISRLYSFHEKTITFTIKVESEDHCQNISTELYPLQSGEILQFLKKTGFKNIEIYSDLKFNPYIQYQSDNICVFAYVDH